MSNVRIEYDPHTWGSQKWHVARFVDGQWQREASSLTKHHLQLEDNDVIVHIDDGVPDPPLNADGSMDYYKEDGNIYTRAHLPPPDYRHP